MSTAVNMTRTLLLCTLITWIVSCSGTFTPPPFVTIGVCLSSSLADYPAVHGAINYARYLTNLDFSVIPATDINITEVDCGTTYSSAFNAATTLLNTDGIIGVIGGQSQIQSNGIAAAATAIGKPFVSIHSVTPLLKSAAVTDTWTFRLSASDYSQASGFWDLYAAYLNPTLQENYPILEQVSIHVIYSSDDPASAAIYQQLIFHSNFLGVSINSTTDLQVAGHSVATANTALTSLIAATPSSNSHTLWVISSTSVLSDLLTAADSLNLLSTYLWVLNEECSLAVAESALSSTIRVQAQGMIGLVRGKGYVAQDRMFSPYPYTDLAGNSMNWSAYTLSRYGSTYPYPSISAQFAFDSIGTFARALTTLLAVASEGAVYERGDLILANLMTVSYVGASGPIAFQPNGDRKTVRFDYVQLYQDEPAPGYKLIGAWSPLTGANLFERDPPPFNRSLGGNGFLDVPYERVELAYSSVGFSYTWNSIPVQGVPPPKRYGACVVVSKALNALIVIDGVESSNSVPYSDVWSYSFVSQAWTVRPVSGDVPDRRNYGGCTIKDDYVYLFGGLSSNGIKGDMWKFQVSTNQWIQVPLDSNLAGRAQRAQYAVTTMADGMAIWGGRHRPTINTEMWLWSISSESFTINPITYNSTSWVQPGTPPYSDDLHVETLLTGDTAPITVETTINGIDVLVMVGGYLVNTSVAFIYDLSTGLLTPMYTSGENPGFRSLTDGVVFGTKLYINRGWDENAGLNYPTVYTLDLACPGVTCGQWALHVTMADHRDSLPSNLYGEQIITFGGWGEDVHNDMTAFNTLTPNVKETLHSDYYAPPGRKFHSTCLIGNQMVVFGGISSDGVARNEMYTLALDTQIWVNYPANSDTPFARYGLSAGSGRLGMYIFGGTNELGTIFNDLNVFSLPTVTWQTYTAASFADPTIAWPAGRVYHSTISVDDQFIYLYGGLGASGAYFTDMWQWDITKTRFTLMFDSHADPDPANASTWYTDYGSVTQPTPIDFERVQPLIQSASVYSDRFMYFIGGLDSGLDPVGNVYAYELPKDETSAGQWYQLPSLPVARNQHGATLMSGKIYVYGGLFYEVVSSEMYAYTLSTSTWELIDSATSWNVPRPMAGGSMETYGNSITMFGGSSAEFGQLHSASFLLSESWQYSGGAACNGNDPMINGENCTVCSPGTTPSLQWCIPCAAGYYWSDASGTPECTPCSPGTAGSLIGTSSFASCLPCGNGTYSPLPGASECLPCDPDKYCPIRSRVQLPIPTEGNQTKYEQVQPVPYDTSVSKKVSDDTLVLTFVLIAALCAAVVFYVLANCGPKRFNGMDKLDLLFQFNHLQFLNKPMIRRRTPTGGICTIVAIVLVCYLLVVLTLPYSMDNIIETRSLIPNVATQVRFEGDITAKATLTGYPGACVVPGTTNQCDPGITVSVGDPVNFLNATKAISTCVDTSTALDEGCQVTWYCPFCTVPVKDTVTVRFESDNSYATKIDWSFVTSSGYPDQNSEVFGTVHSGDAVVFRGTTQPTNVQIGLSQTLYTEQYRGLQSTGYHLNFIDRTLGDTTPPITFYASNGILVAYSLQLQLQTMNVARAEKQTQVQFIGSLLGSISGVIGGIAVVMGLTETAEEVVFIRTGREDRGTEAMLNAILKKHDDQVARKVEDELDVVQSTNKRPKKSARTPGEGDTNDGGGSREASILRNGGGVAPAASNSSAARASPEEGASLPPSGLTTQRSENISAAGPGVEMSSVSALHPIKADHSEGIKVHISDPENTMVGI